MTDNYGKRLNIISDEIYRIVMDNKDKLNSVIKYERSTIKKKVTKLRGSFPVEGPATIVTPPQKIKTPTLNMFIANPFAASPM